MSLNNRNPNHNNQISIKIDPAANVTFDNICPMCFGSGKVKAMQMAAYIGGGSIRVEDTKVECPHCNGRGWVK